jgi:hypothetical protein
MSCICLESHFRLSQVKNQSDVPEPNVSYPLTSPQSSAVEVDRQAHVQYCKPIVSTAEDDESPVFQWTEPYRGKIEVCMDTVTSSSGNWDPTLFGSTEALAEDIAVLESSSTSRQAVVEFPKPSSNARMHWQRNQHDIRSIKRGEVSPIREPSERPHRVVRWSTVEMMMSGDSETTFNDNVGSERYSMDATNFAGNGSSNCHSQIGRNDLVLQRPSSISKRNFSTDTNFTIDENMIDQDLDCEHAFDNIFDANNSANQDFEE